MATAAAADEHPEKRGRSPWMWVSIVLAVVAVGLLAWALTTKSDLDSANADKAALEQQNEQGKEAGSAAATAAKTAYDDVTQDLGATTQDLAATEQDLKDAEQAATKAQDDADTAKQQAADAKSDSAKAQAAADEAQAELDAAESKARIAADCAKAYVTAIGGLFGGGDVKAAAGKVKQDLQGITADCKTALAGS
jgi:cytoskeletal protein RodZ